MNDPHTLQQAASDLVASIRAAARQEQFLEVVSAEEATRRFHAEIDLTPLGAEDVALGAALAFGGGRQMVPSAA